MTSPENEGDAFVEFHADTKPVEPEARRGIKRAADNIERDLDGVGEDWGEALGKSLGDELEDQSPDIARKLERGLGKQKVVTKVRYELDRDNNVVKRFVERTVTELEGAFEEAARPGGIFSKVGAAISDAIGAGFNISGRSPLIALLIPVLGAIIGLVIAAIQAVNALFAVFLTLPAVVAAVGLQVGVLLVAFKGVGTAIQGAFAAKNAKELNEAIKGLTPSAQKFVKSLLPLKAIFDSLRQGLQEQFFLGFGNVVTKIIETLGPNLPKLEAVAFALGQMFSTVLEVFSSPTFLEFFNSIIPSISKFLGGLGPGLNTFLLGITNMSTALIPFLDSLGGGLNRFLMDAGNFLFNLASDPEFLNWLDRMKVTLKELGALIVSATNFVVTLANELDKAGGNNLLTTLTDALNTLSAFLESPTGQKALEGLIHLTQLAIVSVTGGLLIILALFAAVEFIAEWIKNTVWPFLRDTLGPGLGKVLEEIGRAAVELFMSVFTIWPMFVEKAINFFKELGTKIKEQVVGWVGRLREAGAAVMQGLIDGIRDKFGPLARIIEEGMRILSRFIPGSPAEEGPLSGRGYTKLRGQRMMADFAAGIASQDNLIRNTSSEAMSQVTIGNGAVVINYQGPLPSEGQMTRFGSAAGNALANTLAARNTRLAVRTL